MRVLVVGSPEDERIAQHCRLLISAGWSVHVASPRPGTFDGRLLPGIMIHFPPRPTPSAPTPPGNSTLISLRDRAKRRVRVAVSRAGSGIEDRVSRISGRELGPGPWAILPVGSSSVSHNLSDNLLLGLGFWPEFDIKWLAGLITRLAPDIMNGFGMTEGIVLSLAGHAQFGQESPPLILTFLDVDSDSLRRESGAVAWLEEALVAADGLIVERQDQLRVLRARGFSGREYVVGPIGGGWPLPVCRALRQPGPSSQRMSIAVSGVQDAVGRAIVALRGIELAADALSGFRIVVWGATQDVMLAARLIGVRTGLEIEVLPRIRQDERLRALAQARCTVALSAADVTDPALLEAAVMGSFPIAAETDRNRDWFRPGKTALFVQPEDPISICIALRHATLDDALVDSAVRENDQVVDQRLDREGIGQDMLELYRRAARLHSHR